MVREEEEQWLKDHIVFLQRQLHLKLNKMGAGAFTSTGVNAAQAKEFLGDK